MGRPPTPLAQRIRDEVTARGWTAYRLAKESGVPLRTTARFMKKSPPPTLTLENAERLMRALDWHVVPRIRRKP